MNINFELYKVFYEVANAKSISKGAEKLMISQPAVSQSIQTLESELGGTLFIRTKRGVILTDEGLELYNYVKEGMNYFINGTNKFMKLKELDEGVLRIGASTVISENYLISYLSHFHKLYPNIIVKITNDLTDNLIKGLRNGSLDIIIVSYCNEDIKDLKFNYLSELHDIFVSNKKCSYKIENLLDEGILIQDKNSITRKNFDSFIKNNNLRYNIKMEVVSNRLLSKLVEEDFGIGLLTKEFITDRLGKSLFEVETNVNIPSRKIMYATKKDTIPSFTTKKMIEILKGKK